MLCKDIVRDRAKVRDIAASLTIIQVRLLPNSVDRIWTVCTLVCPIIVEFEPNFEGWLFDV